MDERHRLRHYYEDQDYESQLERMGLLSRKEDSAAKFKSPREALFYSLGDSWVLDRLNYLVVMPSKEQSFIRGNYNQITKLCDDTALLLRTWMKRKDKKKVTKLYDIGLPKLLGEGLSVSDFEQSDLVNQELWQIKSFHSSLQFEEMFPNQKSYTDMHAFVMQMKNYFISRMTCKLVEIFGMEGFGNLSFDLWEKIVKQANYDTELTALQNLHPDEGGDIMEWESIQHITTAFLHFHQLLITLLYGFPILSKSIHGALQLDSIANQFITENRRLLALVTDLHSGTRESSNGTSLGLAESIDRGWLSQQNLDCQEPDEMQVSSDMGRHAFYSTIVSPVIVSLDFDGTVAYVSTQVQKQSTNACASSYKSPAKISFMHYGTKSLHRSVTLENLVHFPGTALSEHMALTSNSLSYFSLGKQNLYLYTVSFDLGKWTTPKVVLRHKVALCKECLPHVPKLIKPMSLKLKVFRHDLAKNGLAYLVCYEGNHCSLISMILPQDDNEKFDILETQWSFEPGSKLVAHKGCVVVIDAKIQNDGLVRRIYHLDQKDLNCIIQLDIKSLVMFDQNPTWNMLAIVDSKGRFNMLEILKNGKFDIIQRGMLPNYLSKFRNTCFFLSGCFIYSKNHPFLRLWVKQDIQVKDIVAYDCGSAKEHVLTTLVNNQEGLNRKLRYDFKNIFVYSSPKRVTDVMDVSAHGHIVPISDNMMLIDAEKRLCWGRSMIRFFSNVKDKRESDQKLLLSTKD